MPPPATHPVEHLAPARALSPHLTRKAARAGIFQSQAVCSPAGQCDCASLPDWPRVAGCVRRRLPLLLRAGARRGRRCFVLSEARKFDRAAMPNRKPSRNAYYFFVQEKIPELRRRGLPVARVADAIPYCSADWAVRLERSERAGPGSWASRRVRREGRRPRGGQAAWPCQRKRKAPVCGPGQTDTRTTSL